MMTWKEENLKRLDEFSKFKFGWFSDEEGEPIPAEVIEYSKSIIESFYDYTRLYVFPISYGGIQIETIDDKELGYLEIEISISDKLEISTSFFFVSYLDDEFTFSKDIDPSDVHDVIHKYFNGKLLSNISQYKDFETRNRIM